MVSSKRASGAAAPAGLAVIPRTQPPSRPRRLSWSFLVINTALYGVVTGVSAVLLPVQLQDLSDEDKATALGLILCVGAFAAMVTQPAVGWLSDRTRTRLGRRAPFILAGGAGAAGVLLGLSVGGLSAILLGLGWCLIQITLNVLKGPLQAVVVDRVPSAERALTSTFIGVGAMIGGIGGSVVAARLAHQLVFCYGLLAALIVASAVLFVLLNPDPDATSASASGGSPTTLRGGVFSGRKPSRSFWWLFTARFLFVLGYAWYGSYTLYLLEDYLGLDEEAAIGVVPVLAAIGAVVTLASILLSGRLTHRLGRRRILLVVSAVLTAGGIALPAAFRVLAAIYLAAVLVAVGFGIYTALSVAAMADVLPDLHSAARDLGVMNMASTLAQVFSPLLAAWAIGGVADNYGLMLGIGAAITATSAVAFARVRAIR
jgi:MFS family permease